MKNLETFGFLKIIGLENNRKSWGIVVSGSGIIKRKRKKRIARKVEQGNYFKTGCQCIYG